MGEMKGFYLMPHAPVLIPEIGDRQIKYVKSTFNACYDVASDIAKLEPDTIIMITPHGPLFDDAIAISGDDSLYGNFESFGHDQIGMECKVQKELTDKIVAFSAQNKIPVIKVNKNSAKVYGAFVELDHGSMVPLYFVNKKYTNYKIVNITYGLLTKLELYKFGMIIRKAVSESKNNVVMIASGDLSHCLSDEGPYNYHEDGEVFDRKLINLLENGSVVEVFNMDNNLIQNACECGLKSCYILLGALSEYNIRGKVLSYEGPFGVGYGVMKIEAESKTGDMSGKVYQSVEQAYEKKQNHPDPYIRLARQTIAEYLKTNTYIDTPEYVTEEMKQKSQGVFVSLKKNGKLRGCIGTILPDTDNVASEIINNAVNSAFEDPRFMPVKQDELVEIDVTVDVLTEPQLTTEEQLDPKKYGIIVKNEKKTGVLLPDLEDIETVGEQIDIALRKAGILKNEEFELYKFEVVRHKE